MRGALALTAALAVATLSACAPAPASVDLTGVLTAADAPPGMTWVPSGAELTADDDLHTVEHDWEDGAGEPADCLPLYLVPYGLAPTDEGSSDRTVEVGYFAVDDGAGSILVNAREFPDDRGAADYVQHALEAANACPGYEVGGHVVGPDGFRVARFTGGHGLSIDGGGGADAATTRTAVVAVGRAVLVVDAFLTDAPGIDAAVVDEIARAMLERLG